MRRPVIVQSLGAATIVVVWGVPAHAQTYDWTGFYAGFSSGISSLDGNVTLTYPAGTSASNTVYFDSGLPIFSNSGGAPGGIPFPGAAQLPLGNVAAINFGYDMQEGLVVFGGEIEATKLLGHGQTWTTGTVTDSTNQREHTVTASGGVDHLFGARAKVGVSLDKLLLFGSGGLAVGHANLSTTAHLFDDNGYGDGVADWDGRTSAWKVGFIAGIGAEYALTDTLSIKLEGQYYNLGSLNVTAAGTGTDNAISQAVPSYSGQLNLSGTIVKGGFNLRFN